MKKIFLVLIVVFLAAFMAGCGGPNPAASTAVPNPSNPPANPAPFISADVESSPAPGNTNNLFVWVRNSSGTPISTATVKINGVALSYSTAISPNSNQPYNGYVGRMIITPGQQISLSVTIPGYAQTYVVSGTMPVTYPNPTAPANNSIWVTANQNTVSWSAGSPETDPNASNVVYGFSIMKPAGPWVYASPWFSVLGAGSYFYNVPANSLPAGSNYVISTYITKTFTMANGQPGSGMFLVGVGQPITVTAQ